MTRTRPFLSASLFVFLTNFLALKYVGPKCALIQMNVINVCLFLVEVKIRYS